MCAAGELSCNYHFLEGESMRVMYEVWFVKYKVDVVFAVHVHAYERSREDAAQLHQFILHAALDIVQDLAWTTSAM
uniref:Trafficking protein particle complex subunit 2 n=1 Tax=Quercus lobata TaxID=97700 RepID=A0A7N2N028_QUELO